MGSEFLGNKLAMDMGTKARNEFIIDATYKGSLLFWSNDGLFLFANNYNFVAYFWWRGKVSNVDHSKVHADSADNGARFALNENVTLVG